MPPRLPLPSSSALSRCFSNLRVSPTSAPRLVPFSTTPSVSEAKKKTRHRDTESIAFSEKRRRANLALQEKLKQSRLSNAVNPVTGRDTPFLKSLETPSPLLPPVDWALTHDIDPTKGHDNALHMNFFLTPDDLETAIKRSEQLTTPVNPVSVTGVINDYIQPERIEAHKLEHNHAVAAIQRIVSLSIGSNADRQRVNTIRCINTFGRHVTDNTLPPDSNAPPRNPPVTDGTLPPDPNAPPHKPSIKTPRAGPDTGSSEVQAAILTVKIRNVAKMLEKSGNKDKHNKRNLRLLVHRRQKLLKYLKRKEKGGVRYRNIMDALGLDEAAVQKELSI